MQKKQYRKSDVWFYHSDTCLCYILFVLLHLSKAFNIYCSGLWDPTYPSPLNTTAQLIPPGLQQHLLLTLLMVLFWRFVAQLPGLWWVAWAHPIVYWRALTEHKPLNNVNAASGDTHKTFWPILVVEWHPVFYLTLPFQLAPFYISNSTNIWTCQTSSLCHAFS